MNAPKGSFDGPRQSFTIGANDQIFSARRLRTDYRRLQERRARSAGRCRQCHRQRGERSARALGRDEAGRKPAVILDIQRQPGANIIETADRVKELLPQLAGSLPPSVNVDVLADRTETIRASVQRRAIHFAAHGRSGRDGDVSVSCGSFGPP